jgi:hypothetical protein
VPEILHILKDLLVVNRAFEAEGIFRKSGDEFLMSTLKRKINEGAAIVCDDVHSIGTLLKVCSCVASIIINLYILFVGLFFKQMLTYELKITLYYRDGSRNCH